MRRGGTLGEEGASEVPGGTGEWDWWGGWPLGKRAGGRDRCAEGWSCPRKYGEGLDPPPHTD